MKEDKILVSVVMCTYNGMRFIRESIDSILSQTFHDFELIVWNDGSTDKTEEIVRSYDDPRIRYFYHENTGLGEALNLACQQAQGKYIARIDDDDICMSNRLQKQVDYLETHPNCILLSSSCYYINEEGKIVGRSLFCTWNSVIKKTLKVGSATIHPAAMFRTDAYKNTCGYLGLKSSQDRVLWSKMARFGEFHNLSLALIKYRLVSNSLSHCVENNPYSSILEEVRRKMIEDEIVSERDILLYNDIYRLSKSQLKEMKAFAYSPKMEERLYALIKPLLGDCITSDLLIFFKNIYCFIIK